MSVRIERAGERHLAPWAGLRAELWPDQDAQAHGEELAETLAAASGRDFACVALTGEGVCVGFAEAALRSDYVNGCETSPVVFLEGIFVAEPRRRSGIARMLCRAVAAWGRARGCSEFASDAAIDNAASLAFHRALGFVETERVVFFRKAIGTPETGEG
ncbi:aminoglycoside 6'-N-acetyltransferase [Bosea sp. UC22_33]|uniref:aminoglycoside 6'-N-acetyltransferase n=1 Tax=Bosea sp. UC22_33 TaxID=3350165 RepID=UPI00366D69F0